MSLWRFAACFPKLAATCMFNNNGAPCPVSKSVISTHRRIVRSNVALESLGSAGIYVGASLSDKMFV